MANKITNTDNYTAIANAIRAKLGVQTTYTPPQMAAAIASIPTGGGTDEAAEFFVALLGNTTDLRNYAALPDSIIDLNPTTIGEETFREKTNLRLESLPDTITSIGQYAFYNISNLPLASLPSGLGNINQYAFYNCQNMPLEELPSGVWTIGERAFYQCYGLGLEALPDGLTSIGQYAFAQCRNLALFLLPTSVNTIGAYAFQNCTGLKSERETEEEGGVIVIDTIPFQVYGTVGSNAFIGCTGIEHVKVFGPKLGTGNTACACFKNCTGLKTAWISSDCTNIYGSSVNYGPFNGCTSLTDIYTDAPSKPSGWATYYNYIASGSTVTVHFNTSEAAYNEIVGAAE